MYFLFSKKIVQMAAIRAAAVIAALWLQIWLVAEFGAAAYGEYVFFVTLCSLVMILSKGGLDTLALKAAALVLNSGGGEAAMRRIRLQYLRNGLFSTLATCLLLWLVYVAVSEWRTGLPVLDWRLICGASVGAVLFQILVAFARGMGRPAMADAFDAVARNGLMAAVAVVLVSAHYVNATAIVISYSLSFYLASLLLYQLTSVAAPDRAERAGPSANEHYGVKAHFGFMFAGLLSFVFFQMDTLILGAYIDPVELGAYNMACNLVRAVIFIPMILSVLIQPRIAVAFEKSDMRLIIKIATGAIGASFAAAVTCCALLWLFGEFILAWIDPVFVAAKQTMLVLAVAHIVNSILIIVGGVLSMTSKYLDVVRAQLVGGGVALVCYALLIPKYEQIGAALSMFVGLLFVLAYYVFIYRKHIPKVYGILLSKVK